MEDDLEFYWDDLRVASHRVAPPPSLKDFGDQVQPGDMVIGTSRLRILLIIKPDGTLVYGPEYKPDEAATIFWEVLGQKRLEMEDRILLFQHMEAVLTRLGDADLRAESARRIAAGTPDNEALEQRAVEAVRHLERVASQAIELGRGLIRRPGVPMPAFPSSLPRTIQAAEHSSYEGLQEPDP